jgi:hypothetical protein
VTITVKGSAWEVLPRASVSLTDGEAITSG